jgi:dolichol-phosphate mannosyltransferase
VKHPNTPGDAVTGAPTEQPELHIVVPVYNEAENFPAFHASIERHVRTPFRLLVVYDRDEDTTVPVAQEIAQRDPRIMLLKNTEKGVLGALKTGLSYPRTGAVLVTMADGSDDHRCVDTMFELYRQGYHLVAASRYSKGGKQQGGPWVKKLLSRAAGASLHMLAGVGTWDATNNFKLYSTELLRQVRIESEGGFEVALELTVKAHRLGLPMAEVPTVWTDRVAGKSNFKLAKWLPCYFRWYAEAIYHATRSALPLVKAP